MKTGLILSNNPRIGEMLHAGLQCRVQEDATALDILTQARDLIHQNHILLTHPLHSSLKPNETPFRSVVVSTKPAEALDMESLCYIETAIEVYHRFLRDVEPLDWPEEVLQDFQIIDADLIRNALY